MSHHRFHAAARGGTILIVVAGICALLASISIAFMVRIRAGSDMGETLARETQAKLMLHAACCYILEAGRLGYGPSRQQAQQPAQAGNGMIGGGPGGTLQTREGYGWIDVRAADLVGPLDQAMTSVVGRSGQWPDVGGIVICPMYRWVRPPYAIKATVAYNPILIDPARSGDPRYGRPLLLDPDPQPAIDNGWPGSISQSNWNAFVSGDPTPVMASSGTAWFRVYRKSAATFIVTCGAGGTMGYRDWNEVIAPAPAVTGAPGGANGAALFNNDRGFFDNLRTSEVRTWYEVRWSGAVRPLDFRFEEPRWWIRLQNGVAYRTYPVNGSQYTGWCRANKFNPNPVGTISYIQRLEARDDGPVDPATGPIGVW